MPSNKRDGGDHAGRSNKNKRARSFHSGVWSGLGKKLALKLSKSVVSLALSDGHSVLYSFSGIAIEPMMFLTTASFARALKQHDNLKIEVRHEGNVVLGNLEKYDLDHEIAVVTTTSSLDVHAVFLYNLSQYMPFCDVVSLGRDITGKLMTTNGKLTPDSSRSEDSGYLMFSSCKLSEVFKGGPVFDYTGDFVGMNLVPSMEKSFFLPVRLISERLEHFVTSQHWAVFLARVNKLMPERVKGRLPDIPHSYPEAPAVASSKDHSDFEALGYPRPPPDSDMILVNTFEKPFGNVYCRGVWKQLSKGVCQKIYKSVVSLASFNGDKRFFACSGTFIDWDGIQDNECQTILTSACLVRNPNYPYDGGNKIVDGLRIQVLLPGMKRRELTEGTLIHYSLNYNVALVSVKTSCAVSFPVRRGVLEDLRSKLVAAVGRCFESGDLMASIGEPVTHWSGPFDFKRLLYAKCEVSKAGIGGPLVDTEGNYIGMNFYDQKVGNPVLRCDDIVDVLDCFKKGTSAELDSESVPRKRWPVPRPKWIHPSDYKVMTDSESRIVASGRPFRYLCGDIHVLK